MDEDDARAWILVVAPHADTWSITNEGGGWRGTETSLDIVWGAGGPERQFIVDRSQHPSDSTFRGAIFPGEMPEFPPAE